MTKKQQAINYVGRFILSGEKGVTVEGWNTDKQLREAIKIIGLDYIELKVVTRKGKKEMFLMNMIRIKEAIALEGKMS